MLHKRNYLLGKHPGRTLQRLGAAIGGCWIASNLLNIIWPNTQVFNRNSSSSYTEKTLKKTINLLVIHNDSDLIANTRSNYLANLSTPNNIMLFTFKDNKPPEILIISKGYKVFSPINNQKISLYRIYKDLGLEATRLILSKAIEKQPKKIQRYIIIPKNGLKLFINSLGGIRISSKGHPKEVINKKSVLGGINSNLIILSNGKQVDEYLNQNNSSIKEKNNINGIQSVAFGIQKRLKDKLIISRISNITSQFHEQIETNLSVEELEALILSATSTNQFPIVQIAH